MTKVALSGAGGNIGRKLRRHFEARGDRLRLLDRVDGGERLGERYAEIAMDGGGLYRRREQRCTGETLAMPAGREPIGIARLDGKP